MTAGDGRAACAGVDAEAEGFFALSGDRLARRAALHAITTYCDQCDIRPSCLARARAAGEVGVWGGVLFPGTFSRLVGQEITADMLRQPRTKWPRVA